LGAKRDKTPFVFLIHLKACPARDNCIRRSPRRKEHPMLDLILLALGLGFFALSVGYTIACDHL
jgi:hypothetical protein